MKLATAIIKQLSEESESPDMLKNINERLSELGFEGITAEDIQIDAETKAVEVTFTDDESELLAVFFVDEELGPVVTVIEDEQELEDDEISVIQLDAPVINGMIDFNNGISWLSEDDIEEILTFGADSDEIEERAIFVIRGGKKVKKKIIRKKRKKRLNAKRKMAIRRAVRKKRAKKAQIQRKRKRSLKIRKRANLKNKPKKTRVVG